MSIFDPQRLYYHTERKTHQGQVIQKKPVDHNHAIKKSEIPRAKTVLSAFGYTIQDPGESNLSILTDSISYTNFLTTKIAEGQHGYEFSFNNLYSLVYNQFSDLFTHESNEIIDFEYNLILHPFTFRTQTGTTTSAINVVTPYLEWTINVSSNQNQWSFYPDSQTTCFYFQNGGPATLLYANQSPYGFLGYLHSHEVSNYNQLKSNHALDEDRDLLIFEANNANQSGYITNYSIEYTFVITVSYLGQPESP